MANPVLIIIAVVFFILLIVANLYILVYFQHEEDKNTAIFPKILVVSFLFDARTKAFTCALGVLTDSGVRKCSYVTA